MQLTGDLPGTAAPSTQTAVHAGLAAAIVRMPGYVGQVPYLLVMRLAILAGMVLRLAIHHGDYQGRRTEALSIVFAGMLIAVVMSIPRVRRYVARVAPAACVLVIADAALISLAYLSTKTLESDFFLFYFLPIITASEYLPGRLLSPVFLLLTTAFFAVIDTLAAQHVPPLSLSTALVRVFLPRELFFLGCAATSWYLFRVERSQAQKLLRDQEKLEALISSVQTANRATLRSLELDRQLDLILGVVTEELGFEFALVSLKDDYRGVVEAVRSRNVPPGLVARIRYPLSAPDVQTEVIRTGRSIHIEGPNPLLNPDIYSRFGHDSLVRTWMPLKAGDEVIGTIEFGCDRSRKDRLFTPAQLERVARCAEQSGPLLAAMRPQQSLREIAEYAIDLIGADSASLHVFQGRPGRWEHEARMSPRELADTLGWDQPILAAGAGRATTDFIQHYPPRQGGLGWEAVLALVHGETDCVRAVQDEELRAGHPKLYDVGVRAIMAVPFEVGSEVRGVLYVHFWQPHVFSERERQLERMYAGQMAVAIQSHLLMRKVASEIQDSRTLLEWLPLIHAEVTSGDQSKALETLAERVVLVTDATNVVLYEYLESSRAFLAPPHLKGSFQQRDLMRQDIEPQHLVYNLRGETLPLYYEDVARERPEWTKAATGMEKSRFLVREGIASTAILELRAATEFFGYLFVNYQTLRKFTLEERRNLQALAASTAAAVRTARFYRWQELSKKQLAALAEIDRAIVAGAREQDDFRIMASIVRQALVITNTQNGALLRPIAAGGLQAVVVTREGERQVSLPRDGVLASLLGSSEPRRLNDVPADLAPYWPSAVGVTAIPLKDGAWSSGLLCVGGPPAVQTDDLVPLQTLAVQAVIAMHSVDNYRRLGLEARRARALALVATSIQDRALDLDTVLHLILTGVTAGESLGFSRAMLFVPDAGGRTLKGRWAVGQSTAARSHEVWECIARDKPSFDRLLIDAASMAEGIRNDPATLCSAVCSMQVEVGAQDGGLARCARAKEARVSVPTEAEDVFRAQLAQALGSDEVGRAAFACVRLEGRTGTLGVLVADNRFHAHELESISEDMLDRLTAFAELAAMSLERAQLTEKEEIQTYEDLAHQIRTPISNAVAAAEHLAKQLQPSGEIAECCVRLDAQLRHAKRVSESLRLYADLAHGRLPTLKCVTSDAAAVCRLIENSVGSFRVLARPADGGAEEALDFAFEGGSVRAALGASVLSIDHDLFRQALESLLDNALRYSYRKEKPGRARRPVEVVVRRDASGDRLDIMVANYGLPLTAEDVEKVRLRGWRGPHAEKVTTAGKGIGLWVTDQIMTAHHGTLTAHPTDDTGRTEFRLSFPIGGDYGTSDAAPGTVTQ